MKTKRPPTPSTARLPAGEACDSFQAGPRSRALFLEEQRHLAPGLQSFALFSQIAIKSGRGATLRDEDDREYLDFLAGIGVASLGYSHPESVRVLS